MPWPHPRASNETTSSWFSLGQFCPHVSSEITVEVILCKYSRHSSAWARQFLSTPKQTTMLFCQPPHVSAPPQCIHAAACAQCRHLWGLALEALGVGYFRDHSKPSIWQEQVRLTARQLQPQAVTNTHPAILHYIIQDRIPVNTRRRTTQWRIAGWVDGCRSE